MRSTTSLFSACSLFLITVVQASRAQDTQVIASQNQSRLVIAVYANPVVKGVPTKIALVAVNQKGNIADDFSGSVQLQVTDPGANIPTSVSFTSSDDGVHLLSNITFSSLGTHTISGSARIGKVTVQAVATVLVISDNAQLPCPTIIGDIDVDGDVDDGDVELLSNNIQGLIPLGCLQIIAADVVPDGHLNQTDVQALSLIIGDDTEPPGDVPPGEPPHCAVQILAPLDGTYINQDKVVVAFRVFGPIATFAEVQPHLNVFSNRPVFPPTRKSIAPGDNLLTRLGDLFEIHADGTMVLALEEMLPIGPNTITIVSCHEGGEICCAKVSINVTGVEVLVAPEEILAETKVKGVTEPSQVLVAGVEVDPDADNISIRWSDPNPPAERHSAIKFRPSNRQATVVEVPERTSRDVPSADVEVTLNWVASAGPEVSLDAAIVAMVFQDEVPRLANVNLSKHPQPGDMVNITGIAEIPQDQIGLKWSDELQIKLKDAVPPSNIKKGDAKKFLKDTPSQNILDLTFAVGSNGLWTITVEVTGKYVPRDDLKGSLKVVDQPKMEFVLGIMVDNIDPNTGFPQLFVNRVNAFVAKLQQAQAKIDAAKAKAPEQRNEIENFIVRVMARKRVNFNRLVALAGMGSPGYFTLAGNIVTKFGRTFALTNIPLREGQWDVAGNGKVAIAPSGLTDQEFEGTLIHELTHVLFADEVNQALATARQTNPQAQLNDPGIDQDQDQLLDGERDPNSNTATDPGKKIDQNEEATREAEANLMDVLNRQIPKLE
jgi:hypothetical protein